MQNFSRRWLQSIDSYDDIDKLRQTLMMEQFLQTVSIELKIWLVDQKPKTVDEMARLADQYVALRKQATSTQQQSTKTQQFATVKQVTKHKLSSNHMNTKVAALLCIGNSFHKTNHRHLRLKQNVCFVHFARNLIIRLANAKNLKYAEIR